MKEVKRIKVIEGGRPDDVLLVTASFELERSLAVVRRMESYACKAGIILSLYPDTSALGEQRKRRAARTLFREVGRMDQRGMPASVVSASHDPIELVRGVREELETRGLTSPGLYVTIDMSCLTKIHLVALLRLFLVQRRARVLRLLYVYPKTYNTGGWEKEGRLAMEYSEPVVLPLQGRTTQRRERRKRVAIVVVGHEGERTFASWRQIDADVTWLVEGTSDREAVMETCWYENRYLYDLVRSGSGGDRIFSFANTELEGVEKILGAALDGMNQRGELEVVVVPFGPKPILAGLCCALFLRPDMVAGLIYSRSRSYNAEYSTGVENVYTSEIWATVDGARSLPEG